MVPSMDTRIAWPDHVQRMISGDLVTVFAYPTRAGGAIAIPVSPNGQGDREAGRIGMTTSLAFPSKLRQLLRDPRAAMAFHTREHGFATDPGFVLAQGEAIVNLTPDPQRLAAFYPEMERFLGPTPTGRFWDWLLKEYLEQRIFIDIPLRRILAWEDDLATGTPALYGEALPEAPASQEPPAKGTAPRIAVPKLYEQMHKLPHQLLAFLGADGFPVIVPVRVAGHDERGLLLDASTGRLPEGGRRASIAAHAFGPHASSLVNRSGTGWLEVSGETAIWSPHTSSGFTVPPVKVVQNLANGMMAKQRMRKNRKTGVIDDLHALQDAGSGV